MKNQQKQLTRAQMKNVIGGVGTPEGMYKCTIYCSGSSYGFNHTSTTPCTVETSKVILRGKERLKFTIISDGDVRVFCLA